MIYKLPVLLVCFPKFCHFNRFVGRKKHVII